ncbi:hypothetical protein IWW57_004877, partial [Coemansia sp. S610]
EWYFVNHPLLLLDADLADYPDILHKAVSHARQVLQRPSTTEATVFISPIDDPIAGHSYDNGTVNILLRHLDDIPLLVAAPLIVSGHTLRWRFIDSIPVPIIVHAPLRALPFQVEGCLRSIGKLADFAPLTGIGSCYNGEWAATLTLPLGKQLPEYTHMRAHGKNLIIFAASASQGKCPGCYNNCVLACNCSAPHCHPAKLGYKVEPLAPGADRSPSITQATTTLSAQTTDHIESVNNTAGDLDHESPGDEDFDLSATMAASLLDD